MPIYLLFSTLNEIKLLKACTASGLDDVSPKVVKAIANYIVKPLTHIFNLSFLTGIITNALKIARLTPVYKANSKENFSNYRPSLFGQDVWILASFFFA